MARTTRTARRMLRRGTRRPAHVLLALLLAVLTASAVACGLTTTVSGPSQPMATVDHAAMAGYIRPATAMESEGPDGCPSPAGGPREDVRSPDDCEAAPCAQGSGRPHASCCDSPGQDGINVTSPVVAPPTSPHPDASYLPTASSPHRPDAAASGPGPPDLHMLQLLRI